jgi:hypothetical protein
VWLDATDRPTDGRANPGEFVRYHQTTDLQDGTDVEGLRFVDQLEIDGDRTDEIVIELASCGSEAFATYKCQNYRSLQVLVDGGGC